MCKLCGFNKSAEDFYKHKRVCKICVNIKCREYRLNHRDIKRDNW